MAVAEVPLQLDLLKRTSPRRATVVILVGSALVLAGLFAVIYGHGRAEGLPGWVSYLPAVNALLNATSAIFIGLAVAAIRRRDVVAHARRMLVALGASTLFLVCYVAYHSVHGDTHFGGEGPVRPIYFFVLISHIVLSAVALPLVFTSLFFSLSGRFARHRRLARIAYPAWLYVSVTGVLVFALLRAYGPAK